MNILIRTGGYFKNIFMSIKFFIEVKIMSDIKNKLKGIVDASKNLKNATGKTREERTEEERTEEEE